MAASAEESPNGTRPTLGVLADQPLDNDRDDRLGYGDFADALAELIDHPDTKTPLTIAISGPWGVGKTTLAKLVDGRLKAWREREGEPEHITCWFDAWMHDDAPHLGSAFAAEVAKRADRERSPVRRFLRPLPSTLLSSDGRRRRLLYILLTTFVLAGTAAIFPQKIIDLLLSVFPHITATQTQDQTSTHYTYMIRLALLLFVVIPATVTLWAKISPIARAIAGFTKDPEKEASTGSIQEVSDQLGALLQQAMDNKHRTKDDKRRFVIFVDNLERCKPQRAVEVCEVANQLLSHPGVVTVLVADMASIARCADIEYAGLESRYPAAETPRVDRSSAGETYGQRYLEKIVQIQFDLPVLSASSLRNLVNHPPQSEGGAPESDHASGPITGPSRKEHILDVASRWGWKISFWLSVLALILGVALFPNSGSPNTFASILGIPFVALLVFLLIRFGMLTQRLWRRLMARRNKKAVDEQIERDGEGADFSVERLAAKMQQSGKVDLGLIKQRFTRHANDEQLRQADTALLPLLPFFPPLPRSTKRLVSLLRVLLLIAERRKMLGGAPEVTIQHLVKWAVLICGWPQLGSTLSAYPEKMADLEDAGDFGELTGRLRELGYDRPVTKDLAGLLQSPVKLAPVMSQIVAYEPATESTNSDGLLTISTAAQASSDGALGDGLHARMLGKNGSAER